MLRADEIKRCSPASCFGSKAAICILTQDLRQRCFTNYSPNFTYSKFNKIHLHDRDDTLRLVKSVRKHAKLDLRYVVSVRDDLFVHGLLADALPLDIKRLILEPGSILLIFHLAMLRFGVQACRLCAWA